MIRWILRRIPYVRELEAALREEQRYRDDYQNIASYLRECLEEYYEKETTFTKLTLDEAHELFSICMDYQRALKMLNSADPVQTRLIQIMDKYGITVERNTVADDVTPEEVEKIVKAMQGRSNEDA